MLTLSEARSMIMDPIHGKYVGRSGGWTSDISRYLQLAIDYLGDVNVKDLTPSDYRKFWVSLAQEHSRDPSKFGVRAIEIAVGSLRTLMIWLASERKVPAGTGMPPHRWKAEMHRDFSRITGQPLTAPQKPRFTREEAAKLWDALPSADARVRLAVIIGSDMPLGQVVRARRSDILPLDGEEFGALRVRGRGTQRGGVIPLAGPQRSQLTREMTDGVLANLESAFLQKKIKDYVLIPGGYLSRGRAQVKYAMTSLSQRVLRKQWHDLERLAGVEHIKGRGWYGLRRRRRDDARRSAKGLTSDFLVTETILPSALYENTRGFVQALSKQINASYEYSLFDGCAVLMRRLVEVLLVLSYEHAGIEARIQNQSGSYISLEGIIGDAKTNPILRLSRNSKGILDEFRLLGNFAAHKIYYTTQQMDVRRVAQEYRALIEELLYKAGIRK
jgi:hypothetical protein